MTTCLIEKIVTNIDLVLDITDENILNELCMHYFSKKDKTSVLYLVKNDKIPKSMTARLFGFISDNNFLDLFLELDYNKFDIHTNHNFMLMSSRENGNLDLVKILVEKGADIHDLGDYSLYNACCSGHIEIVKYLIEKGANIHTRYYEMLEWSRIFGHTDVYNFLIEKNPIV